MLPVVGWNETKFCFISRPWNKTETKH